MKKITTNKKGVTLCEVLVAMTIFAIMSLMLATMVSTTARMNIKNHKMNKQMQDQGQVVEQDDKTIASKTDDLNFNIKFVGRPDEFNYSIEKYQSGNTSDYSNYKYFD